MLGICDHCSKITSNDFLVSDLHGGRICGELCCDTSTVLQQNASSLFKKYLTKVQIRSRRDPKVVFGNIRWLTRNFRMDGSPEFMEKLECLN